MYETERVGWQEVNPPPSSPSVLYLAPHRMASNPGPPPDLTARYALKAKYARLQRAYARALEVR